jgi:hypothetical protein
MEQTAATISAQLVNREIKGFRFFNLNDSYFVFEPDALWIFDTGVQIDFTDGFFSFGWNSEFDAFDYSADKTMPELQTNELLYTVDSEETAVLDRLAGTAITDVAFDWDYFQEYDEFAQLKDEKIYVPVGLKLTFDNGETLQLAAIRYGINADTKGIAKAQYSLDGQLLAAFNKKVEIAPAH